MAEVKTKPTAKKTTAKKSAAGDVPEVAAAPAVEEAAAVAKKPATRKKAAVVEKPVPGAEERYKMTELAAYYIAQRNGFVGDPKVFWEEAEQQIAQMLSSKPS